MTGSQQGPDDVEGHRATQDTEAADEEQAATDDVEGHRLSQDTEAIDEDDAEGHLRPPTGAGRTWSSGPPA